MNGSASQRRADLAGGCRTAWWVVALLVVSACSTPERQETAGAATVNAGTVVEYAGCQRVLVGPICILGAERRLRLWVPGEGQTAIAIDGASMEPSATPIGLGRRFDLDLSRRQELREEREVTVTVTTGDHPPWQLVVRSPPAEDWWSDARRIWRTGDVDAARARVDAARAAGEVNEAWASSALARIARFGGESDIAAGLLEASIAGHRADGEVLQAWLDVETLIFHRLYGDPDLASARQLLEALETGPGGPDPGRPDPGRPDPGRPDPGRPDPGRPDPGRPDPGGPDPGGPDPDRPAEAVWIASNYAGHLANLTGDPRRALEHLRTAVDRAERLDLGERFLASGQLLASQLAELGRHEDASVWMRRLIEAAPADLHPCPRGQLLNNAGWIAFLGVEAGASVEDPGERFGEAVRIFAEGCPQLPGERLNALLNLVLADLHAGRVETARRHLHEVIEQGEASDLAMRLWGLEAEARLARFDRRFDEALRAYEGMATLADAAADPEGQWRASLGRARVLDAMERSDEAIVLLTEAEAGLDRVTAWVPLHEGREAFVETREAAIRLLLDLLLDAEREAEAMTVARRARSRVLRGLRSASRLAALSDDARATWDCSVSEYRRRRAELDELAAGGWRLPEDRQRYVEALRDATRTRSLRDLDAALTPLIEPSEAPILSTARADEVQLVYHPLDEGWVGFAAADGRVRVERLDCPTDASDPEGFADCWLRPFAELIEQRERVRFLPYGPLRQIDWHALPWQSDVLLAAKSVVYGLDLGERPSRASIEPRALVIADAAGDLPAARREAAAVVAEWIAEGWEVELLKGRQAISSTVRQRLPAVDRLHYAGHARFDGPGGWQSALPLADGGRLTVGDILTLERVPALVVLSGCETARADDGSAVETSSLAHAFLVAGAEHVVAASRRIDDQDTAHLIDRFYRRQADGQSAAEALRAAQLDLRAERPSADWAAFRLVEP